MDLGKERKNERKKERKNSGFFFCKKERKNFDNSHEKVQKKGEKNRR